MKAGGWWKFMNGEWGVKLPVGGVIGWFGGDVLERRYGVRGCGLSIRGVEKAIVLCG